MKKLLFTSHFLLLTSYLSFSQIDMGLPVVTGKGGAANGIVKDWECIGINPANLGWKNNYRFSISAMIVGISAQSKALDYGQLKNAIIYPSDPFVTTDKILFADLFTTQDGLNLQSNINWLTFSFAIPKVGGFAMNLRDRSFAHVTLNENTADILFNGMNAEIFNDTLAFLKNMSTIFNGSKISYMHYRELNLAYGKKLFGIGGTKDSRTVSFYGGIGFKYLWGLGNFEMIAEKGALTGRSALSSKYGVNYGNIKNFTPETSSGIFPSVGSGTAFDVGMGVGIGKIKITFSAVDMGKIIWDKNVLMAVDTLMPDTSQFIYGGLNSWNIAEQASNMFNDSGIIKFKPGSAYSTHILSKFRIGVGCQFTKRIVAGADMVLPMTDNPANLEKAFFALGTEIALADNFFFSVGVSGNSNYGFSIPFGITLGRFARIMEVRIATNDVLTYFTHGSNPNISLALSLFRFNVDKKK
ncbi:MAG: hypothetical protein AABZ32_04390 [Bacteroidota bacterium]